MMVRTLKKTDEGLALIIDPAILELLGLDPDGPLNVTTDGTALIIRSAQTAPTDAAEMSFDDLLEQAMNDHDSAFRRLAE